MPPVPPQFFFCVFVSTRGPKRLKFLDYILPHAIYRKIGSLFIGENCVLFKIWWQWMICIATNKIVHFIRSKKKAKNHQLTSEILLVVFQKFYFPNPWEPIKRQLRHFKTWYVIWPGKERVLSVRRSFICNWIPADVNFTLHISIFLNSKIPKQKIRSFLFYSVGSTCWP